MRRHWLERALTLEEVCIAAKFTRRILEVMDSSLLFLGIACSRIHSSMSFCMTLVSNQQ